MSTDQERYSKPMPWVGIYVAVASVICTLAMAADTFQGFRHRQLWFPCKFFTLNAASLTVIAVAMKLPVDMNNPMPRYVDQLAKLNSLPFMYTMMCNFMPSLGPMGNNQLLMNITALAILVITVAVNVCIQLSTTLLQPYYYGYIDSSFSIDYYFGIIFYGYIWIYMSVAPMIILLMISTSLALMVPISKSILEHKYRDMHKIASTDQESEGMADKFNVEKLKHNISMYWIMAETSSPQFVMACSPALCASGALCLLGAIFPLLAVGFLCAYPDGLRRYGSDYKWSIPFILVTQSIGIFVGCIAILFRCFSALSFKLSKKWGKSHLRVFKVESYWTRRLEDWKQTRIDLHLGGRKSKKLAHDMKNLILIFFIGLQSMIVVACKIIRLLLIFFVVLFSFCVHYFKLLKAKFMGSTPSASGNHTGLAFERSTEPKLGRYVLQLQDEVELAERTLRSISKSVKHFIHKGEKQQPRNLMKLLEKSMGFNGVTEFDRDQIPALHSEESPNCWSLTVVTLTSIAIALPNLGDGVVDLLLSGVNEGLVYMNLVEESLHEKGNLVCARAVANKMWLEVELYHKWLGENLQIKDHKGKMCEEILQWLGDKAKEIVMESNKSSNGGVEEISHSKFIAAHSMYTISQTVLLDYQGHDDWTDEVLFEQLSVMIGDILAACFTNLPRVINMKCYDEAIEKREESVRFAARLLGETKEILKILQERELPCLNPDQLAYIDEWRGYFKHPNP